MADSGRLRELFDRAIELSPGERSAFLADACGGEDDLRHEVDRLIAAHDRFSTLFDEVERDDAMPPIVTEPGATATIGPYRILQPIGHGGMGSVFLAVRDDDQYTKRVAIKVLREGVWSPDLVRRFKHERQMLASIDHPYIAKLLDGGATTSGLPYIVMEYVDGQPLDLYCDAQRLGIRERLELFRKVCAAVHCAHQNLIVHRDLKPQNVLVTTDGTPKLVDFGIAKPLKPELMALTVDATQADARMMTPEYASPEQINGETVTTATDVYSLGALLYELLTGHRPYRVKAGDVTELLRAIREEEPTRPSAVVDLHDVPAAPVSTARGTTHERLRRSLRGDLDNVVLMAMRKQPERRYASAEQLSDDISRYLDGLPVRAQRDTLSYRARKFVARHRTGVAASVVVAAGLVVAVVAVSAQAAAIARERDRAEAARVRAEREATKAQAVSQFLQETLGSANPFTGVGRTVTLLDVLNKMSRTSDQVYSGDLEIDAAVRTMIGATYTEVGRYEDADALLTRALDTRRRVLGPANPDVTDGLAHLAYLRRWQGKHAESVSLYREALTILRGLPQRDPVREADYLHGLGVVTSDKGNEREAIEIFEEALRISRGSSFPQNRQTGEILSSLGVSHRRLGDFHLAERSYRDALPLLRRHLGAAHPQIVTTLNNLAVALESQLRHEEAVEVNREALDMRKATLGDQHPLVANSMINLAVALEMTGDIRGAEALDRQALEITRAALGPEHPRVAQILANLGNNLGYQGRFLEGERAHEESLRIRRKVFGPSSREVSNSLRSLGWALKRQHKLAAAEPLLRDSIDTSVKVNGADAVETIEARTALASLLCEKRADAQALSLFTAASKFFEAEVPRVYRRAVSVS